ncbi:coenzyme F420-0:L-glutamate ligase [Methanosarcina sp. UBA411]|jgi:coenzyme F420-0:L-glutamate ligase|uniref:coenzyme F420-0:L-glutamate ligase n=1 Tax=Methanosarcina sp. UBA411 TaxID=1915589 RepID=UPI0025D64E14|nr:coenzyme F420-0:L-glutamate ligase [Methanosarcina sp. UBA411]
MSSKNISIQIFGIKTPIIREGDDIVQILETALEEAGLVPVEGDIFVLAESAVGTAERRVVKLESVTPGERAKVLGEKYEIDPREMELVLQECDEIFGGVPGAALTITKGVLAPNAGIDASNAPEGHVILLPEDPRKSSEKIRKELEQRYSCKLGVIIGDSRTQPLRLGCSGIALGVSGFVPVEDARGTNDIYGKPLRITYKAVADNLVSAAELLMGEAGERVPCVLIRGAPVNMVNESLDVPTIPMEGCMYFGNIIRSMTGDKGRGKKE